MNTNNKLIMIDPEITDNIITNNKGKMNTNMYIIIFNNRMYDDSFKNILNESFTKNVYTLPDTDSTKIFVSTSTNLEEMSNRSKHLSRLSKSIKEIIEITIQIFIMFVQNKFNKTNLLNF